MIPDGLDLFVKLVTIVSLLGAPMFYFGKRHMNKKSRQKLISTNLYIELEDTYLTLTGMKKEFRKKPVIYDKKYEIYGIFLNYDVYDPLVFSGQINFLNHKLQQPMQDIFKMIKNRNGYVSKLIEYEDGLYLKVYAWDDLVPLGKKYCNFILNTDKKLLEKIPQTMERLKNNFGLEMPRRVGTAPRSGTDEDTG